MDPNLQIKANPGCKELLLRKLSFAVTSSVVSQVIILIIALFMVNFNILHPIEWLSLTFTQLTSISTWLFVLPFLSIIFAQSIICAKGYVLSPIWCTRRIQKVLYAFSLRNIILLALHIFSGGLITWLYLLLIGGKYGNVFEKCKKDHYCLNTEFFYLITSGLWIGLYYFIRIYASENRIVFPVVQQPKLLQFKTKLIPIIKHSQKISFWPTIYFIVVYYLWGNIILGYVSEIFNLYKIDSSFSFITILFSWFFSTLYIFTMKLMRFFFELFLTEPLDFPIISFNSNELTLSYALSVNIPIIQHLACFDLFLFSRSSIEKRKLCFILSQPGNHPHNWNNLVESMLKILSEYTEALNVSLNAVFSSESIKKFETSSMSIQQTPSKKMYSNNMRNLTIENLNIPLDIINVTQNNTFPFSSSINSLIENAIEKISIVSTMLKAKFGIDYLFGHLPLKNIECCLENGQIIIWITQGLSNLIVASLKEDSFGVVQKDLPVILSTLVELKTSIEKLNKISTFTRRTYSDDDFNIKMKFGIHSAVKRSLYNICKHFGPYINDIPLRKEILQSLQLHLIEK